MKQGAHNIRVQPPRATDKALQRPHRAYHDIAAKPLPLGAKDPAAAAASPMRRPTCTESSHARREALPSRHAVRPQAQSGTQRSFVHRCGLNCPLRPVKTYSVILNVDSLNVYGDTLFSGPERMVALLIIQSVVQGITEFLPVSSSGHLVLIWSAAAWMGVDTSFSNAE
ncbi:MAG: undecaprenyl-diphosphate phosphatase, partial [Pseudomonadota bacterium]|nr:undecaprenyl-diphosphate phosphatase [Pseudomonadota bacterium]